MYFRLLGMSRLNSELLVYIMHLRANIVTL